MNDVTKYGRVWRKCAGKRVLLDGGMGGGGGIGGGSVASTVLMLKPFANLTEGADSVRVIGTILFDKCAHTQSIAFRLLSPDSARKSYVTEGALFISAQLSTDAVSALRKMWVLIRLEAT